MKRTLMMSAATLASWCVMADTEVVDGLEWTYVVSDGEASVGGGVIDSTAIWVGDAKTVVIPSVLGGYPVTGIGCRAFDHFELLTSVSIPSSVTSIGELAFWCCRSLPSVEIPNNVTNIGRSAFMDCTSLTSVTIPSGVTSIEWCAFDGCSGLTSVTIPSGVTSIEQCAFANCTGLTSVKIPSSVMSIGFGAFEFCEGLTSINLSEGLVSIGEQSFFSCSKLTNVTIPSSVKSIGEDAFCYCVGLTTISVAKDNADYFSREGVLFNKSLTELICYPSAKAGTAYSIPSSVKSIANGAFFNVNGLTSMTIPSTVTSIGDGAFANCIGLTSVTIQNGVTSICEGAFGSCEGLMSVTIPSSVTRIGDEAFYDCDKLQKVCVEKGDAERVRQLYSWKSGIEFVESSASTPVKSYIVTLEANGGSCSSSKVEAKKGESVGTLPVATRDGYSFLGWFTKSSGGTKITTSMVVKSDVTWYAQWEKNADDSDDPIVPFQDDDLTADFDGTSKHTFNGLVFDPDGEMCGMAQITTAKATAKGVKVSGFVMLTDGKKQTIKSATGTVSDGYLTAKTSVGKLGSMEITIGGNGFKGTLGDMTLATEETDEDTGILSGTLKLSYFDAKTGKVKTKSITIGGVASGGEAVGTATVKGQAAKSFAAEVE